MTHMTPKRDIRRGFGSKERPLTKDLLALDSDQSSPVVRESGNFEPDNIHIDYKRYYDPDYARQEIDKLWMKTWLLACREEEIPEIGDRMPFDVGPRSFLIIRSGPDAFKAFHNACLHRGTQLCDSKSSGHSISCPFHAWEWEIDGSLKKIPSWWDFTGVTRANGALPEVKLGRWGGFIFINADPDCVPLETALGPVPRHFAGYKIEDLYTYARARKLVPANWKLLREGFQESYHLVGTHPQGLPFNGESQSQYDIWDSEDSHVARIITPGMIPSMNAGPEATNLEAAKIYVASMKDWHFPDAEFPTLDPDGDLRKQLADWHREMHLKYYNRVVEGPDTVLLDVVIYLLFPHVNIWMSESLPMVYVITPHATDPALSYMDVRILLPCPPGKPRPPATVATEIGLDEKFSEKAEGFGPVLGPVHDQDLDNMPRLQRGVQSTAPGRHHSHLGTYQEIIIQHWHVLFDRYMSR